MRSFLASVAVLSALGTIASASDKQTQRDRDAKAALALALAAKKSATSVAPRPHDAGGLISYSLGYEKVVAEQKPLVVFVSCQGHKVDGAVVSFAKKLDGVDKPSVVVGYPQGQKIFIDSTIDCHVAPEAINKAVAKASKKIDVPPGKCGQVAPKPADWKVSADDLAVMLTTALVGVVGDDCPNGICPTGTCVTGSCSAGASGSRFFQRPARRGPIRSLLARLFGR